MTMNRDELLAVIGALEMLKKNWIAGATANGDSERYLRTPRGLALLDLAVQRTVAGEDEDTIRAWMATWVADMRAHDKRARAQALIHAHILSELLQEELQKFPPYEER